MGRLSGACGDGDSDGPMGHPDAFPEDAYKALVFPDLFFIPLYVLTAILLLRKCLVGYVIGLIAGGGVMYVLIYLFRLAKFKGPATLLRMECFSL